MSLRQNVLRGVIGFWLGGPLVAPAADPSVARLWDEQNLAAIRSDTPHPPVQARNLFSLSVCLYDAWAAYDPVAVGYLFHEKLSAADVPAARREAISYAAYRMLAERYAYSKSASNTLATLAAQMASLGLPTNNVSLDPATPPGWATGSMPSSPHSS